MAKMYWPVPAIPPKPPQITLLGSSLAPPDADNDNYDPDSPEGQVAFAQLVEQTGLLPSDLRAELQLRREEPWLGGFGYFPEAHSAAVNRSPFDNTTVDNPLDPPNLPKVEVQPWQIGTKFTLSALAFQEDFVGRATRQNDAAIYEALESEFWSGTLAKANGWPNNYLAGPRSTDITPSPTAPASVEAASAPTLPLTITHAVNDTFVLHSANDPNSPDTFTIAPGVYTTIAALVAAVAAATSTATGNAPLSTYVNVSSTGGKIVLTEIVRGTVGNADEITEGDGGAAAIGFSSLPATFSGGANATPVTIARGLALLQKALSDNGFGGQGMIHCPVDVLPNLLSIRRVGKNVLDSVDNIVVPGVGYSGTGPSTDPPAAGTAWMYATDMVATRIQRETRIIPDTFEEALDRGQGGLPNTVTFRANRLGAAYFDASVQVAVLVDLPE